jgi:hypothetical protein
MEHPMDHEVATPHTSRAEQLVAKFDADGVVERIAADFRTVVGDDVGTPLRARLAHDVRAAFAAGVQHASLLLRQHQSMVTMLRSATDEAGAAKARARALEVRVAQLETSTRTSAFERECARLTRELAERDAQLNRIREGLRGGLRARLGSLVMLVELLRASAPNGAAK